MINNGQINKGQVNNFVKCLKLVVVYRSFHKNKIWAAKAKDFRTPKDSTAITFKWNYY